MANVFCNCQQLVHIIRQQESMLVPRSRDIMRKSGTVTALHNREQPAKQTGPYWPQCCQPNEEPRKQCLQTDIGRQ